MERIINFTGELNDELGNYVVNELLDIYDKNKAIIETNERLKYQSDYLPLYADTVEFRINSNGGDLYKFLEIYDLMERMKKEQSVIFKARVSSHAYSAGMYLFCACDYRTMSKFGSLMYHELSMMRMDKLSDLESETHRMAKIQKILDDIVTRDTGLTQEILDSYRGRDFWLGYDEAMELGVIKDEPSEQEQLAKALEDIEKENMTQSEFDAFVEEMKHYINIIPDEDKIKEIEEDKKPDMTLGEAVKDLLGEDFRCNGEVKCDEFGDRCCYMCEDFDKCDGLCEYAESAEMCKHMEDKLDELDSKCKCEVPCEDCECEHEEEITEWKCGIATTCDSICCKFCDKFLENIYCEDMCDTVSKDMKFDDCEFAKEKK